MNRKQFLQKATPVCLILGALALTGCIPEEPSMHQTPVESTPTSGTQGNMQEAELKISVQLKEDGEPLEATISCPSGDLTGYLVDPNIVDKGDMICDSLTANQSALYPSSDRVCTQQYGGPETAHITGTLDDTNIDVTITRSDGCGISDWDALEFLLLPPE